MHFGYALDSSCIQDMSSRRLQHMPSRCYEDIFSVRVFRLPRRLQDNLRDVLKTFSRRLFFKTYSRCNQDVLEDEQLLRWRRVEEVFKTCLEDVFKTSWRRLEDVLKTNKCLLSWHSGNIQCRFTLKRVRDMIRMVGYWYLLIVLSEMVGYWYFQKIPPQIGEWYRNANWCSKCFKLIHFQIIKVVCRN